MRKPSPYYRRGHLHRVDAYEGAILFALQIERQWLICQNFG